jgi:hypothetical protein
MQNFVQHPNAGKAEAAEIAAAASRRDRIRERLVAARPELVAATAALDAAMQRAEEFGQRVAAARAATEAAESELFALAKGEALLGPDGTLTAAAGRLADRIGPARAAWHATELACQVAVDERGAATAAVNTARRLVDDLEAALPAAEEALANFGFLRTAGGRMGARIAAALDKVLE